MPAKDVFFELIEDILNVLPVGVILLDRDGRALCRNRAADDIIRQDNGLILDAEGYCRAASTIETLDLERLIKQAVLIESRKVAGMRLTRPRSVHPLPVLVSLLPGHSEDTDHPCAILFLGPPDRSDDPAPEILARLYGLSLTEAQLVLALIHGETLNEFAKARRVSQNTVRTQLRQVLKKTGTHRQTELVKQILIGPA